MWDAVARLKLRSYNRLDKHIAICLFVHGLIPPLSLGLTTGAFFLKNIFETVDASVADDVILRATQPKFILSWQYQKSNPSFLWSE